MVKGPFGPSWLKGHRVVAVLQAEPLCVLAVAHATRSVRLGWVMPLSALSDDLDTIRRRLPILTAVMQHSGGALVVPVAIEPIGTDQVVFLTPWPGPALADVLRDDPTTRREFLSIIGSPNPSGQ